MSLADAEAHQRRHGFAPAFVPIIPEAVPVGANGKHKLHRARQPNKTEAEFGHILDARLARGEHLFHAFEAITLQWGDGMKYTADWPVFQLTGRILLIEVKGGYKWQKDVIRYKGCSAQWRDYFDFEMHEKKNGIWQRID
jgi:hypothetical protein